MPITLTPDITSQSVLIEVSGVPADSILMRTDRNGTAPVRLFPNQGFASGSLIVTDSEAALFGLVSYTAGTATAAFEFNPAFDLPDVLATPVLPANRAIPLMTLDHSYSRPSTSTEHQVIGRADPLAVLAPLGFKSGTLRFLVQSAEDADAVESVYDRGEAVFIRFSATRNPDGTRTATSGDLYHFAQSVNVRPDTSRTNSRYWEVSVSYSEVRRPTAPLAGSAGWTFDQLTAEVSTFDAVPLSYSTFDNLTAKRGV